jgi:hypothetical protein
MNRDNPNIYVRKSVTVHYPSLQQKSTTDLLIETIKNKTSQKKAIMNLQFEMDKLQLEFRKNVELIYTLSEEI